MNSRIAQLSQNARQAIAQRNGRVLHESFTKILQIDPLSAEGNFLQGVFFKVQQKQNEAKAAFKKALKVDAGRYDAAVELADILSFSQDNAEAVRLLKISEKAMSGSCRLSRKSRAI